MSPGHRQGRASKRAAGIFPALSSCALLSRGVGVLLPTVHARIRLPLTNQVQGQGMNFIAALLLIVSQDEERAFWMFVCAFDALGVEGYYTEGMTLLRADMQVLASCMQVKCAKVSRTLNQFNVDLLSISSRVVHHMVRKKLACADGSASMGHAFFRGLQGSLPRVHRHFQADRAGCAQKRRL